MRRAAKNSRLKNVRLSSFVHCYHYFLFLFVPGGMNFLLCFCCYHLLLFWFRTAMFNLFVSYIRLLLKTPKRAVPLFVCLKWLFGEADFAHTLVPEVYWIIAVADVSTKHNKWMQRSNTRRERDSDQPKKRSYSQTEKTFQLP